MKYFFVMIFLLTGSMLNSQSVRNEKILISGKVGYHSANNDKIDNSFTDGFLLDLSVEARVYNHIYLGINYQYWDNTDDNYFIGNFGTRRDYTANAVGLFGKYRVGQRELRAIIGAGAGNFNITTTSPSSKNEDNYFYVKAILGLEYKFSKNIMITLEGDYNSLFNAENKANYFAVRVGPTVNLDF